MTYSKATEDAYTDFVDIRAQLEAVGIEVLSGEAADGLLTITTDLQIPAELQAALGLEQV